MELPEDVIRIINEYSKPLTRPDWRTLHKMRISDFYYNVIKKSSIHVVDTIRIEASQQWLLYWSTQWIHQREHNWSFERKGIIHSNLYF